MELLGAINARSPQKGDSGDCPVTLDFVLLTGPPNVGKTTIGRGLAETGICKHLHSDSDIFHPIFHLWPDPAIRGLVNHIGEMERWMPLWKQMDFDRLFQVFHRDWLICNGLPRVVVADGFVYHGRHWRTLVAQALEVLPSSVVRHHLWVLHPGTEEFHRRFEKSVRRDPRSEGYEFYFHGLTSNEERMRFSSGVLKKFFQEYEPPVPGDPWSGNYRELVTDTDVECAVKTLNQ